MYPNPLKQKHRKGDIVLGTSLPVPFIPRPWNYCAGPTRFCLDRYRTRSVRHRIPGRYSRPCQAERRGADDPRGPGTTRL